MKSVWPSIMHFACFFYGTHCVFYTEKEENCKISIAFLHIIYYNKFVDMERNREMTIMNL